MTYDYVPVSTVANSILRKFIEKDHALSHLQLQKLVYLVVGWYKALHQEDLIDKKFEVWKYGPVNSEIYKKFKHYGSAPIADYCKEDNGNVYVFSQQNEKLQKVLSDVIDYYGLFSGSYLSQLTHENGTPWYKAKQNGEAYIELEDIAQHLNQKYPAGIPKA